MQALPTSLAPASGSNRTGSDRWRRWRDAAAELLGPAAVFVAAWSLVEIPISLAQGKAWGWRLVVFSATNPLIMVSVLVALIAVIEASTLRARGRTFATVGAGIAAAALGNAIGFPILIAVEFVSTPPPWAPENFFGLSAVLWWINFGWCAAFCTGAVLAYDYRVRSTRRAAALRKVRLQAAGVIRRTAEIRLQAMQARIDPRFLFDALAAVERIHDIDAAAGDRLLDHLIKYLRAVLPDLIAVRSTVGKEIELARVWLDIRDTIVGATGVHAIEATGDVDGRSFPAMTMIPLAEAVLSEAPTSATLTLRAQCNGPLTTVRIDCRSPCAAEPPSVNALRTRLEELYGEQVRLTFTCDAIRGRQAIVEVELAKSDSDHR